MSAKHKGVGPQAMTANNLVNGLVVWMTKDLEWSEDYAAAAKTEDEDLISSMQTAADASVEDNTVVGAYFIDIDPETKMPARYRERFRVNGPSYDPGEILKGAS